MIRKVKFNENIIVYNFEYKKVKNINLRVKSDLSVQVSANKRVSLSYIDDFVISKGDFILSALDLISKRKSFSKVPNFTDDDFAEFISKTFYSVNELFSDKISFKPTFKMREMKSCWGTCNFKKGIITLNKNLIYCTEEQIYYVIIHEFAHFLVHNHSREFYNIVEKYCENYKEIKNEMKNIIL